MPDPELALAALGFVILFGSSGSQAPTTGPPSASIQEHAEGPHHTKRTSQARPHRTYLLYRISGSGQDRCEQRRVVDVETTPYVWQGWPIPLT
jgi:hypothetical protein